MRLNISKTDLRLFLIAAIVVGFIFLFAVTVLIDDQSGTLILGFSAIVAGGFLLGRGLISA
jgi:hypothetical protein